MALGLRVLLTLVVFLLLSACAPQATPPSPSTPVTPRPPPAVTPAPGPPPTTPPATPPTPPPVAPPVETPAPQPPVTLPTPLPTKGQPLATPIAKKLEIPWALDFLPDGSLIFTERPGRIRLINPQGTLRDEPLLTIADIAHRGEGGLLGLAVHPDFAVNGFIYVYYTYQNGSSLANRVVRLRKVGNALVDRKVIIDGIPGAGNHDGGRLKFGPDRFLYITTGDAANPARSQDKNSLSGKVLRIDVNGVEPYGIPPDNPFPGSPVYSFGHRNPQGLAWDAEGKLWATEHGSSATDELNQIQPGQNYGWPTIRGDETATGLVSPALHSGQETWAPSGLAFLNGSLFFTGLRGVSLFEVKLDEKPLVLRRHFAQKFGRLRDVVVGPDKFLYILTNNRDGRGQTTGDDDQIIRIDPGQL